jgi:NADH:ubiquinone oxidoreductase subunit F (NADH-binding)
MKGKFLVEGTGWMEKVLHRIENGHGREEDLLLSIQRNEGIPFVH